MAAGQHMAELVLLPAIRAGLRDLEPAQMRALYAGLLGAVLGYMTADLGPDDAEALHRGGGASFDQVRALLLREAGALN